MPAGRDSLWGKVRNATGHAVLLRAGGSIATTDLVDPDDHTVLRYWLGGHLNLVSDADAATLTTAGYGDYLTWLTTLDGDNGLLVNADFFGTIDANGGLNMPVDILNTLTDPANAVLMGA